MLETSASRPVQGDAYGLILEAIDVGIYKPGSRLVESELAERFGVSHVHRSARRCKGWRRRAF